MTTAAIDLNGLGRSVVTEHELAAMVADVLDTPSARLVSARVEVVDYPIGTIATSALLRVRGEAHDAEGPPRPWSIFVKELQSARVWPHLHLIPEEARAFFISSFPWRLEIDAFHSTVATLLPDGLRLPALYGIREIDDDRASIWMEDVATDDSPWDDDRFARAARLLGELAGRRPLGCDAHFGNNPVIQVPGLALREYAGGRVSSAAIPALLDGDAWGRHPLLGELLDDHEASDLRRRFADWADLLEPMLDLLDALPHTYAHGDASPHNLLVPADGSAEFVVIDWGFSTPLAVGFDLGQLIIGMVNDASIAATRLDRLDPLVFQAYVEGLAAAGLEADAADVRRGFVLSTVVRDLFTALEVDGPPREVTPSNRAHVANRIGLARFLLALADEARPWLHS